MQRGPSFEVVVWAHISQERGGAPGLVDAHGLGANWGGEVEVVEAERERNEDETEGVTHVTHVKSPLPPTDNGRVLCQD